MKSIKSKIRISMLAVVLISSVLIGIIGTISNARGVNILLEATLGSSVTTAARAVEWKLDNYWAPLKEAASTEQFINNASTNPELVEATQGIASRNGFLYVGKMDRNGTASTGENYGTTDYFLECKETQVPVITDLMHDGNRMIFLMEVPIFKNGQFDGVVYGAVDAEFLTDIVSELHLGEQGQAYILDAHGSVIGHPDPSYAVNGVNIIEQAKNDPSVSDIAAVHELMLNGETGLSSYTFDGDYKYFGYAPIDGSEGWSIGVEASQQEFYVPLNTSIILTLFIVLAIAAISCVIAFRLASSISNPIKICVDRLEGLSRGDLQSSVPQLDTKDETASLLSALNTTIGQLEEIVSDVSYHLGKMAAGDFREDLSVQYTGDFVSIQTSMQGIQASLNHTLTRISQAADTVSSSADQVAAGAQSLSQGATEQAGSIQELAATLNEISSHVQSNAENAQHANEDAKRLGNDMEQSNDEMRNLIAAMEEINRTSNKISQIIKTIEDIAFQTNILALNASVEAARAGAAGKGFAVVANEVRDLASKSAEAAKNTSTLIQQSLSAVQNGMDLVDQTAQSLANAVEKSGYVVGALDDIANASNQQAESVNQVSQGIEQISSVVQTTSATSEESAATAEELSSQSHLMRTLVSKFQLNAAASVPSPTSHAEEYAHF